MNLEKIQSIISSIEEDNLNSILLSKENHLTCNNNSLKSIDTIFGLSKREFERHIRYLKIARLWSKNSYCERKKVGAIIVKNDSIISDGYNGTPDGFENTCELENGETKWYTLHAEANAITKLAKSTNSSESSKLYISYSPCRECSKLIIQSGIKEVIFYGFYRDISSFEILLKSNIKLLWISEVFLNEDE